MQKALLVEMLAQNKMTCSYAFENVTEENSCLRVNDKAASIGFIYRHIGESMNLFGLFFGIQTDIRNTTMGQQDTGEPIDLADTQHLIERGYNMLKTLIEETPKQAWLEEIETPFFGSVSRVRLFSHILFHNSHHAGQISLTLSRAHASGQ